MSETLSNHFSQKCGTGTQ